MRLPHKGAPQKPGGSGSECLWLSDKYRGSAIWHAEVLSGSSKFEIKFKPISAVRNSTICWGLCAAAFFIPSVFLQLLFRFRRAAIVAIRFFWIGSLYKKSFLPATSSDIKRAITVVPKFDLK